MNPRLVIRNALPKTPGQAYKALAEARERAAAVYYPCRRRRYCLDPGALETVAARTLGRLQTPDEAEPPPTGAWVAVARSVPAAIGALHRYFHDHQGRLKNEILALEGPGGVGKTSYSYWIAEALGGRIVGSEEALAETLREIVEKRLWVPVLVLDDLAAIISKYWFLDRTGREKWRGLFQAIEYAKDWTGLILATARSYEGLAKRFRELASLVGEWHRYYTGSAVIDAVVWKRQATGEPVYLDILWPGLPLPDTYWEEMLERRRESALRLLPEPGPEAGEP